jgi:hypothetical protein
MGNHPDAKRSGPRASPTGIKLFLLFLSLSLSFFFSPVEPESPTNRHLVLVFVFIDIHQPRRAGYQHLNIELLTWDLELNTRGAWLATTFSRLARLPTPFGLVGSRKIN